jgi:hypothetical protein
MPLLHSKISVPLFSNSTALTWYTGIIIECKELSWTVRFDDKQEKQVKKTSLWQII